MKNIKNKKLVKTDHFLLRVWERGYYDYGINKLIKKLKACEAKSINIIDRKTLKKLNIKKLKSKSKYLVIIIKENCLITLFEIESIYEFLKTNTKHEINIIK